MWTGNFTAFDKILEKILAKVTKITNVCLNFQLNMIEMIQIALWIQRQTTTDTMLDKSGCISL